MGKHWPQTPSLAFICGTLVRQGNQGVSGSLPSLPRSPVWPGQKDLRVDDIDVSPNVKNVKDQGQGVGIAKPLRARLGFAARFDKIQGSAYLVVVRLERVAVSSVERANNTLSGK
jgi:hypothetical protein